MSDPTIDQLRQQITHIDRALLEGFNRRLELVRELWAHKESLGLPLVDPTRENALVRRLAEVNSGPLSNEGLEELFALVLDLTKREVARASEVQA